MNLKKTGLVSCIAIGLTTVILQVGWSWANDSATEVTPTGLQFKREDKISIEREELYISEEKVEVSYEFRNVSDKDIVTEVAFPIPDYEYSYSKIIPSFDYFSVEVNGKVISCNTEVRALVNGKDYSKTLERMNISISDFSDFDPSKQDTYFARLDDKDRRVLISLGLVREDGWPLWMVSKKYYWSQTFPADSSVSIKHRYKPYGGFSPFGFNPRDDIPLAATTESRHFLERDACVDKDTMAALEKYVRPKEGIVYAAWLSYILTTANNWKQPIRTFHLIIEKNEHDLISLCFEHPLTKTGANRYEVVLENFVPTTDLKIYFFEDVSGR